ncbi:MAG: outer membrane lipoprotein-sorting protein [Candidatus Thiosymbion ectosymbiont of Robbea hypermnestra]|nr:outer membrane lipoprotein-sorting protein [Candidatus Thiosymbion ectosymbiont of Robbea hypermnestra]
MRVITLIGVLLGLFLPFGTQAGEPGATDILKNVHLRDRGKDLIWDISLDLIDHRGNTRKRTGKILRRKLDSERSEQVTVFLSPANIRHTALLQVEAKGGDDYMWLYVPALKVTKRIPPADRGDKFVGTDFTMEDVNLGFEYKDYIAKVLERKQAGGHPVAIMRIEPKTDTLKRALGFDHSITTVRVDQSIITEQRFYKGSQEIRRNDASDVRKIDGILTTMVLRSQDLVNNHRTILRVKKATYNSGVPASHFRKQTLAREIYR